MSGTTLRTRTALALGLALLTAALLFGARPERASAGIVFLMGDVNCSESVNSIDAAVTLQHSAGLIGDLPCGRNAHLNADGLITSVDAALILQFVAALIGEPPPVPVHEGSVVSIAGDECRGLDTDAGVYVLSDRSAGSPGQSLRVWGFINNSTSLCGHTPVLMIVAVVTLS